MSAWNSCHRLASCAMSLAWQQNFCGMSTIHLISSMCAHSTASPLAQESNDELERMRHLKDAIFFWDGQKTGWWTKSLYLSPNHLTHLNSTYSNREKLKTLPNIRLGIGELQKTKLNLNTNKNAAANRGLSASLPKNVIFSRNCTFRAYAAMHRMNYEIGASLLRKLEQANCPVASGGHVAKAIHQMRHTQHYHR